MGSDDYGERGEMAANTRTTPGRLPPNSQEGGDYSEQGRRRAGGKGFAVGLRAGNAWGFRSSAVQPRPCDLGLWITCGSRVGLSTCYPQLI